VLERALPVFDELASEVFFGSESIVRCAAHGEIRRAMIAALGKRFQVVKFEAMGFGATRSVRVKVATAVAVALEDAAADGGGNDVRAGVCGCSGDGYRPARALPPSLSPSVSPASIVLRFCSGELAPESFALSIQSRARSPGVSSRTGHVDAMNSCHVGSGGASRAGAGPSGSMRAGTARNGSRMRTSRASSRLVRCLARARTWRRFASVRCGPSMSSPVRWSEGVE